METQIFTILSPLTPVIVGSLDVSPVVFPEPDFVEEDEELLFFGTGVGVGGAVRVVYAT